MTCLSAFQNILTSRSNSTQKVGQDSPHNGIYCVKTAKFTAYYSSDTMFAAPDDESSPPCPNQTPPRAKEPPEAALTATRTPVQKVGLTPAYEDHLPPPLPTITTPMMPLSLPLDDAPQTQEWSNSQQDNSKIVKDGIQI